MFQSKLTSINKEDLEIIVKNCNCYKDILIFMGYSKNSGGSFRILKEKIKSYDISIQHFVIKNRKLIKDIRELLTENSKIGNDALKKHLIKQSLLQYKCIKCNNTGIWENEILSLHLDHINGINNDNRLNNLRFLCPNCHSQTSTYCRKNTIKD